MVVLYCILVPWQVPLSTDCNIKHNHTQTILVRALCMYCIHWESDRTHLMDIHIIKSSTLAIKTRMYNSLMQHYIQCTYKNFFIRITLPYYVLLLGLTVSQSVVSEETSLIVLSYTLLKLLPSTNWMTQHNSTRADNWYQNINVFLPYWEKGSALHIVHSCCDWYWK